MLVRAVVRILMDLLLLLRHNDFHDLDLDHQESARLRYADDFGCARQLA